MAGMMLQHDTCAAVKAAGFSHEDLFKALLK